jgi:hypothetical protein
MTTPTNTSSALSQNAGGSSHQPANLGDILERVLDKGLVIAGDIQVNLLDIELLTIKLRLVVASLDTAKEVGIDWWESDPWLAGDHQLKRQNRELRARLAELEGAEDGRPTVQGVWEPAEDPDNA